MEKENKPSEFFTLLPQWLFVALFAFPVLPLKVTNIIFIIFSVYVLFYWLIYKPIGILETLWSNALVITTPFVAYLIEFIIHYDNPIMQFEFQKKLLFFFAPLSLSIFFTVFKPKGIRYYLDCFTISVVALTIYSIICLIIQGVLLNPESFSNGAFLLRSGFEIISHLHPTYYGLFAATAVLWIVYSFENYPAKWKSVLIATIILLVFLIVLVAAKMPLIILTIGTFWILYFKIYNRKKLFIIYTSLILIVFGLISVVPSLHSRVGEVQTYITSESSHENSIYQRELILSCNFKVAFDNIWTGTGARKSQAMLDNCFESKSPSSTSKDTYNSHNQFFTLLINYGIIELLIFLAMFFILFRQKHFSFGFVLTLCMFLIMLTESILERQMGVYFFVLFTILIVNYNDIEGVEEIEES